MHSIPALKPRKRSKEVLEPAAGLPTRTWRFPQCSFDIECPEALLEQIRRDVDRGRHSQRGEMETGGVLFGVAERERIRILSCRPIPCEHSMGPGFILSARDEKRLEQLIASPSTDAALRGMRALGWYHAHIRSRIFLSDRDRQIHQSYFPAPFQVALVIHPSHESAARAGFFYREESGQMRADSSYQEFVIEAPAMAPEPEPAAPLHREKPLRRPAAAPKLQPERALACPRCGSKHIQRSRRSGPLDQLRGILGFYPYRCHECLSRSYLKTATSLWESVRQHPRKRPEERRRARSRSRREILLWGGGIVGFLAILRYLIRDTGSAPPQP